MEYFESGKLNIICCSSVYERMILENIKANYESQDLTVVEHNEIISPHPVNINIYSEVSPNDVNIWMRSMMNNLDDNTTIILFVRNIDDIFESMKMYGSLYTLFVINTDRYMKHICHDLFHTNSFDNVKFRSKEIHMLLHDDIDDEIDWDEIGFIIPEGFEMYYTVNWL